MKKATTLTDRARTRLELSVLRRAARTMTSGGAALRDATMPTGSSGAPERAERRRALESLERAEENEPGLLASMHELLEALGDPAAALGALTTATGGSSGDPRVEYLSIADVHDLARLCETVDRLGARFDAHEDISPSPPTGAWSAWRALLCGGRADTRRFSLHAGHDERLAQALSEHASATAARAQAATALRAEGDAVLDATRDAFAAAEESQVERERTLRQIEREIISALVDELAPHAAALSSGLAFCSQLDLHVALIFLRQRWRGTWAVELSEPGEPGGSWLDVDGARLPQLEERLAGAGRTITPQRLHVDRGVTLLLGPNMGGKSVALQLVGTIALLAQMGWPIPAVRAAFRPFEAIDLVGGDLASLDQGLSSFGGEMEAIAESLALPEPSLILLDEPARTTAPEEGSAIMHALAESLHQRLGVALIATHHAPSTAADIGAWRRLRVAGLRDVSDDDLRERALVSGWSSALEEWMDYGLIEEDVGSGADADASESDVAASPRSDAFRIAALFGIPESVLARARALRQSDAASTARDGKASAPDGNEKSSRNAEATALEGNEKSRANAEATEHDGKTKSPEDS